MDFDARDKLKMQGISNVLVLKTGIAAAIPVAFSIKGLSLAEQHIINKGTVPFFLRYCPFYLINLFFSLFFIAFATKLG